MRRVVSIIAVLLVAACSGAGPDATPGETSPTTGATVPDTAAPGTTPEEGPTTSPAPIPTTVPPSGPLAPDFSLSLGDGTTFVLSEEARPVFLVFWAEW